MIRRGDKWIVSTPEHNWPFTHYQDARQFEEQMYKGRVHPVEQLLLFGQQISDAYGNSYRMLWDACANKWTIEGLLTDEVYTYDYFRPAWDKYLELTC